MNQLATTTGNGRGVDVSLPPGGPSRVGQGTAVEQSRAQSEVYFRVRLAHDVPRDEAHAAAEMERVCTRLGFAEKAFYKLPRSGQTVEGPSVHLARELARIWGNIDYGVTEMRQDDEYGQSEIQAYAWDLQTNARSQQTFIVPHKKDTKSGAKRLEKMQEIYENNANNGAKRVREAIFAVLPQWLVDDAQRICRDTIARGDGAPLEERITAAIGVFEKDFGVTQAQLIAKLGGRPPEKWDEQDVAGLQVTYRSLKAREVTKEQEFPSTGSSVSADDLVGSGASVDPPAQVSPPEDQPAPAGPPVGHDTPIDPKGAQMKRMQILLKERVGTHREACMDFVSGTVGREIGSSKDLMYAEAAKVIAALEQLPPADDEGSGS
jgi:hypothetical protein